MNNKTIFQSKKAIAMLIGTACVMLIFFSSLATIILIKGLAASEVVSLANMAIVFLGMLVSVAITGQSAVDWKHGSTLASSQTVEDKRYTENKKEEKIIRVEYANAKEKDYKI